MRNLSRPAWYITCRVYLNGAPIREKFDFKLSDNKQKILKKLFGKEWEKYKDVNMEYKSHLFEIDSLVMWE